MAANWYENFFYGVALDLWRKAVTPEQTRTEAGFLEKELAAPAGGTLLDVPCGNGRLSLELANRGYRGVGVDIAEEFIREARQAGADWDWVCGDMRDLGRQSEFDAAFCWGNSFGYLDHEGTRVFLAAVAASLKTGARFVLETGTAAECLLPHLQLRQWFKVDDILFLIERRYQALDSTLEIDYTFIRDGQVDTRPARQCVYTAAEIQRLLAEAGLKTRAAYGSVQGDPFQLGSHRLILVAQKG